MVTDRNQPGGMIQFVPTVERIIYGSGSLDGYLRSEVERLGAHRVFLIAPRSFKQHPALERVSRILAGRIAANSTPACEHVPQEVVIELAAAARQCNSDMIVAIGGGSIIDAAKALRACLGAHLTTTQLISMFMERQEPLPAALIPQISIPTTLSGSEYTRSFSVTDFAAGIKRSYTASAVASRVIIYDPAVTLQTPMTLWLSSGIMAINHALEVLCASPAHIVSDALKLSALTSLITHLPRTRLAPDDLDARLRCQIGAWMADHSPLRTQSLAGGTPALPSHRLAYEFGALCRLPYALSACLTLPACMRWTAARDGAVLARQADVARALGIAQPANSDNDASNRLIARLQTLIAELGLPLKFREAGIGGEQLESVASHFVQRGGSLVSGQPCNDDQVMSLLQQAL